MKDVILVAVLCITAIAVGALLFIYGPTLLSREVADASVAHASIAKGSYAVNIDMEKNYRITNAEELSALWGMVYGQEQPALPRVDFTTHEILAVFDGTHSSGGYDITVERVVDSELTRTVYIEQSEPGETCSVPSVTSSPFEIVSIPKLEGGRTITHIDEVITTECE